MNIHLSIWSWHICQIWRHFWPGSDLNLWHFVQRGNKKKVLSQNKKGASRVADYPAMSFFFVCWHSRKWWPPIRGGTLQMLVLWPEKLNQIDSFCKSGILYAWGGPRSIERCKKHGAPPKKIVFPRPICHFLSLSWKVAATNQDKMILAWKVAATNQAKLILAWKVAACLRFSFLQEIFSNRQWFFLVLVGIYEF